MSTKRMNVFERYLTLWVALCMVLGIFLGKVFPALIQGLRTLEFGGNSHINIPIAGSYMVHDLPNDVESRFFIHPAYWEKTKRLANHPG